MSVVRNSANLILVLTCLTTSQYLSFLFLAMRLLDIVAFDIYFCSFASILLISRAWYCSVSIPLYSVLSFPFYCECHVNCFPSWPSTKLMYNFMFLGILIDVESLSILIPIVFIVSFIQIRQNWRNKISERGCCHFETSNELILKVFWSCFFLSNAQFWLFNIMT